MISWRLPAEESLSDWTLKVKNLDTDEVDVYNVHKAKLCVGPRMCEFFTSMMMGESDRYKETAEACTEMSLVGLAATSFPAFLDFVYGESTTPMEIATESACALFHLADFLRCRAAFEAAGEFIEGDLGRTAVGLIAYMRDGSVFQQEQLVEMATDELSGRYMELGDNSQWSVLGSLNADLMCGLCTKATFVKHFKWSYAVGFFGRAQPDAMTDDFLAVVASKDVMSSMGASEILYFLVVLDGLDNVRGDVGADAGGARAIVEEKKDTDAALIGEGGAEDVAVPEPHAYETLRELCATPLSPRFLPSRTSRWRSCFPLKEAE
jgi:hypothetical protein